MGSVPERMRLDWSRFQRGVHEDNVRRSVVARRESHHGRKQKEDEFVLQKRRMIGCHGSMLLSETLKRVRRWVVYIEIGNEDDGIGNQFHI
ncbi:hypothetical protein HPP92_019121 [Vanilla planifolia]|uniref:Uncharacterized protein n=1 Tax=Vanilla planifolia TaxID=51239 RepID=A0A835Q6Z5_VANPL|nr:hypothetical protein HPP92_019121 [Vanilla planifolia]